MKVIKKTFQYGEHTITLETGAVARQATGAVWISMGDTVLLVTVVGRKQPKEGIDFFPLTVNYQERSYAEGEVPGNFFRREARPSTQEILLSRLIDRPLRPLFPKGFTNEVQVVATLMSIDKEINPDIPAIIGASAALAISGIPFHGPLAAAKVGFANGEYLLNPNTAQLQTSELDLVVAGTADAILMVESSAKELSKDIMLGAVMFGYKQMQQVIQAINEFAAEARKPKWDWQQPEEDAELIAKITDVATPMLKEAYSIREKASRNDKLDAIRDELLATFIDKDNEDAPSKQEILNIIFSLEKKLVRNNILQSNIRIDGRDLKTVRPIYIDLGRLPRAHGSANFTRGETQAIAITTLGTEKDAQIIDVPSLEETNDRFLLHYNFPPYCTGETGMIGTPKRREIGHGNLAKRALLAIMPSKEEFPYVVRVVSEVTESNGSSSMATVCGSSLSLMDAGVPIKAAVAGVAMGLIKEENQFAVLTDILGDEDHLGDMDFKVAGTGNGITALQMDIKITGITEEIMDVALTQAEAARTHILKLMEEKMSAPREHISDFAPRITTIQVKPEKIGSIIGKGGSTIRKIVEETGANIDIDETGIVTISSVDKEASELARRHIEQLTEEPEVGKIYEGKVVKIMDFGAFVKILPETDGLLHISQIANKRVEKVSDYLQEGQMVKVKILEIDRQGKIRLSMKDVSIPV